MRNQIDDFYITKYEQDPEGFIKNYPTVGNRIKSFDEFKPKEIVLNTTDIKILNALIDTSLELLNIQIHIY